MVTVTEHLAERLPQLAESQQRTVEKLVVEAALRLTDSSSRPMPKGMGKYRSGQTVVSQSAREILRDAVRSAARLHCRRAALPSDSNRNFHPLRSATG